jgi:NAD(P)-dependent dehydrogenase (short-subunit alcohol dehydrogenase family)
MNNLMNGRKVLIAGGEHGLGLAFAIRIAEQGSNVVIADVLHELAQEEARRLSALRLVIHAAALDLTSPESIANCADEAFTHLGGVNCEDLKIDTCDRVMDINVRGTWLMINTCFKLLRALGRGAIVNLASDTSLWGAPRLMAYVASKCAIIAMIRSLAREFGADGVTVNAVAPGLTLVEATAYFPKERYDFYLNGRAIKREQVPGKVWGAVVFCLSDLSRFVTGDLIAVNGDFVMH